MHEKSDLPTIIVKDLGVMGYADAFAVQRKAHGQVLAGERPTTVLMVEHPAVVTVSQRKGVEGNLLTSREDLAELGIDVQQTDRGGDITYHGPGQLVVYPIVNLQPLGLNIGRYMRLLENVVIETLDIFGIKATTIKDCTGVWIVAEAAKGNATGDEPKKICAMGVRVRKMVTMHGLAINVNPDMKHYEHIVPCGLADKGVTSMHELLAEKDRPALVEVKVELAQKLIEHLEALMVDGD